MFTLRRITKEGVEINQSLGKSYTLVDRFKTPDAFKRAYKEKYKDGDKDQDVPDYDPKSDDPNKRIFAFVGNGEMIQPIWSNQKSYIMTDGGATFANLTYWID